MSDYENETEQGRSFGGNFNYDNQSVRSDTIHNNHPQETDDGWNNGCSPNEQASGVLARPVDKHRSVLTQKIPNDFDLENVLEFCREIKQSIETASVIDVTCIRKYLILAYKYYLNEYKLDGSVECDETFQFGVNANEIYFLNLIGLESVNVNGGNIPVASSTLNADMFQESLVKTLLKETRDVTTLPNVALSQTTLNVTKNLPYIPTAKRIRYDDERSYCLPMRTFANIPEGVSDVYITNLKLTELTYIPLDKIFHENAVKAKEKSIVLNISEETTSKSSNEIDERNKQTEQQNMSGSIDVLRQQQSSLASTEMSNKALLPDVRGMSKEEAAIFRANYSEISSDKPSHILQPSVNYSNDENLEFPVPLPSEQQISADTGIVIASPSIITPATIGQRRKLIDGSSSALVTITEEKFERGIRNRQTEMEAIVDITSTPVTTEKFQTIIADSLLAATASEYLTIQNDEEMAEVRNQERMCANRIPLSYGYKDWYEILRRHDVALNYNQFCAPPKPKRRRRAKNIQVPVAETQQTFQQELSMLLPEYQLEENVQNVLNNTPPLREPRMNEMGNFETALLTTSVEQSMMPLTALTTTSVAETVMPFTAQPTTSVEETVMPLTALPTALVEESINTEARIAPLAYQAVDTNMPAMEDVMPPIESMELPTQFKITSVISLREPTVTSDEFRQPPIDNLDEIINRHELTASKTSKPNEQPIPMETGISKNDRFVLENVQELTFIEENIETWRSMMSGYKPGAVSASYYDTSILLKEDQRKLEIKMAILDEIIRRPSFQIKRVSTIKTKVDAIIAYSFCLDLSAAGIINLNNVGIVSLKIVI